jgi:glycosyltransferase involved in cell wall biosynthesis
LVLGTVAPHQGAAIFAAAAARASRPLDARVVGPAPFPSYAAAVREAGMGRVQVDGPLQPVEAAATLRGADVLVVPSLWEENAPLVVLEARAASVPVLASRVGGIPELLEDRVDGWLHAPGDVAGLAAQLDVLGDRASLAALRATVRRPRTVPDMAAEISAIYAGVG